MTRIADSAQVDPTAMLGAGVAVWELAQIREHAVVGAGSSLGRGAYLGPGAQLGANCKVQNYALIYEPALIADGVFIGPAAVLTNDVFPRAINPDGTRKDGSDWECVGVVLGHGCSIGARAVCIAPVRVGRWAMVAAGAVVRADVADYALVVGVPARQVGWVGRAGHRLVQVEGGKSGFRVWECPASFERYTERDGVLVSDLD